MIRVALWAGLGAACIVLLAILALIAEPPTPRQPLMRVSGTLLHEPRLPAYLTLAPEKEPPCADC